MILISHARQGTVAWSSLALLAVWLVGCTDIKAGEEETDAASTTPPRWIDVVAGDFASCGLDADGGVECWGHEDLLGVTPELSGQQRLVMGPTSVAALGSDGMITVWNQHLVYAEIYGPAVDVSDSPREVAYIAPDGAGECGDECLFDHVDGKGGFLDVPDQYSTWIGCAIRRDESIVCVDEWGGEEVDSPSGSYAQIACTTYECCALSTEGDIVCGMYDPDDEGSLMTVWLPAEIPGPWSSIAAEDGSLCALDPDGEISCWFASDTNAGDLDAPPAGPFIDLDIGRYHACALGADGEISCWGRDTNGETVVPD